jgi:hypothetical protein
VYWPSPESGHKQLIDALLEIRICEWRRKKEKIRYLVKRGMNSRVLVLVSHVLTDKVTY